MPVEFAVLEAGQVDFCMFCKHIQRQRQQTRWSKWFLRHVGRMPYRQQRGNRAPVSVEAMRDQFVLFEEFQLLGMQLNLLRRSCEAQTNAKTTFHDLTAKHILYVRLFCPRSAILFLEVIHLRDIRVKT